MRFPARQCEVLPNLECLKNYLKNNLTLGYSKSMSKATEAARELARLSVAARRRMWGAEGFRKRMREWGKLGGRPRSKKGNGNGN